MLTYDHHRIIEWPGLKRTTMLIEFQPRCSVQGRQPPEQAAQSHIQPCIGMPPRMGHPQPLWATCSSASSPSEWETSSCWGCTQSQYARSLIKVLRSTGLKADLWKTPLITSVHLHIELLTTTLWLQPSNWFLSHWVVQPSNPYLPFSGHWGFTWQLWLFKCDGEWPGNYISPDPGMHVMGRHRLADIQSHQKVCN